MFYISFLRKACVLIPILFITTISFPVSAQNNTERYSPGGLLDAVFDRWGNKYSLGEIAIDDRTRMFATTNGSKAEQQRMPNDNGGTHSYAATTPAACTPGYFRLYLEAGCGMENAADPAHAARLAVVCQVLTDISNFIPSPCSSTGQTINLVVQHPGGGGGFLGVSTPFFSNPYSLAVSGITDNMIWITLNSGKDAWTNVVNPLYLSTTSGSFFHGSVCFQFDGSVAWHTDLSTPPPAGKNDLYTTVLHEVLHAMGFHTLINYNGSQIFNSGFKYFSRYDRFLRTGSGTPLLTTTSACDIYGLSFNGGLTPSAVLSPGSTATSCPSGYQAGPTVDHTVCAHAVRFVSGTLNVPVYTPSCFERGSSLSHFEDECSVPPGFPIAIPASNNHYYLMSNAGSVGPYSASGNPGAMKRYPSSEERMALCALGYGVNTSYGSAANLNFKDYGAAACAGIGVAGINDGLSAGAYTYVSAGGAPVVIAEAGLLSNDQGATHISCLQVVNGTGVVTGSGASYTYIPGASEYGVVLLRYLPVNSAGVPGNITYVYVYVGSGNCPASPCNMVVNGGFEELFPDSCGPITQFEGIIKCWDVYSASADLYAEDCGSLYGQFDIPIAYTIPPTYVHHMSTSLNKRFLHMEASNSNAGAYWSEGVQTGLSADLIPGQEYEISLWAKIEHRSASFVPFVNNHMLLGVSSSATPHAELPLGQIPSLPAGLNMLWDLELTAQHGEAWHYYKKQFIYTGSTGKRLVIFNAMYLDTYPPGVIYVAADDIDDVRLRPVSSACIFELPSVCSTSLSNIDLRNYVSVPGGTFLWPTMPVVSGAPTYSHSDTLIGADAIAANTAMGGNGLITVGYTYTNAAGCTETVYANIYVLSSFAPPIEGDTSVALGAYTIFDDAAGGGTWTSSNTAIASVDPVTGKIYGVAAGTATITYAIGTDCRVTKKVTVLKPTTGIGTADDAQEKTGILSVRPNPNNGTFMLTGATFQGADEATIYVTDIMGRTVLKDVVAIHNGDIETNISMGAYCTNGIYFLRVLTGEKIQTVKYVLNR